MSRTDSLLMDDSLLLINAKSLRKKLLVEFNDTTFSAHKNYYHFLYYSAFGHGVSVRFEKEDTHFFLKVKTLHPPDSSIRHSYYETEITKHEWEFLEYMVDDYGFWYAPDCKSNLVLDGHYSFLQANRIEREVNHRKLIARRGVQYDKMEALCKNIYLYQEDLVLRYRQNGY
jgi:hypothetical protein